MSDVSGEPYFYHVPSTRCTVIRLRTEPSAFGDEASASHLAGQTLCCLASPRRCQPKSAYPILSIGRPALSSLARRYVDRAVPGSIRPMERAIDGGIENPKHPARSERLLVMVEFLFAGERHVVLKPDVIKKKCNYRKIAMVDQVAAVGV